MKYNAEIYTENDTLTLRGVPMNEVSRVVNETLATGERVEIAVRPATPVLEDYLTYGWPVWCVKLPSGQEHTFVHKGRANAFSRNNNGTQAIKVLRLGNTFRKATAHDSMTTWEIKDFHEAYPEITPRPSKQNTLAKYTEENTKEE